MLTGKQRQMLAGKHMKTARKKRKIKSTDVVSLASMGGAARAVKLSAARKSEIARSGGLARAAAIAVASDGRELAVAKYGTPDRPLKIGDVEIPCYVLEDGTRVLAQRGLQTGIGFSESGGSGGEHRMTRFLAGLAEKGIEIGGLIARIQNPIRFVPPHGGNPAHGYEATILPDICAVVIEAGQSNKLQPQQAHIARQCAVLQHGFATVGIIALVDEATGYEDYRARDALAKILDKFIAKELRPWIRTFPPEFYKQIYRLRGWTFHDDSAARPGVVGRWTNDIVYDRLAPGALAELRRQTPRLESGRLKNKLFQRLTEDHGHPRLREHLTGVVMLMKYAETWEVFMERLDAEYPRPNKTAPALPNPNPVPDPEPETDPR